MISRGPRNAERCTPRPGPRAPGRRRIEYGPNLHAYTVYLLVVHFVPVHRVVEILTSLTGAEPSAGFVHSLLRRAAAALALVICRRCHEDIHAGRGTAPPRK